MSKERKIRIDGDTAFLKLKGGEVVLDAEDVPKISGDGWYIAKNGYAYSNHKKQTMHRLIMNAKNGDVIDHINRNRLDNRKCNLRIATNSINGYNATRKVGATGEKYIVFDHGRYKVAIGGKYLGSSTDLRKAIAIRNREFENSEAKRAGATLD